MSRKLAGRATIRVNGRTYRTFLGATLETGGVRRTPRPGSNDADAYTEEIVPSKLDCEIQHDSTVSTAEIHAIVDSTITYECDTGQVYVITGGYSAEPPVLNDTEGKIKAVFQGPPAEEMV